ncbi:hypothetical protein L3Q82_003015 [Scortum barcoo]|uniref:Uncharacterized protein n=1 Tax=Scortum barcoo TaxID=214431 RepID=A0ACB8VRF0_9TELE|nr:hypothetical protein L3Q82_003015 [Scortum barcoo]
MSKRAKLSGAQGRKKEEKRRKNGRKKEPVESPELDIVPVCIILITANSTDATFLVPYRVAVIIEDEVTYWTHFLLMDRTHKGYNDHVCRGPTLEPGLGFGARRRAPGGRVFAHGTRPGSARNGGNDVGPPSSRLTTRRKVHEGPVQCGLGSSSGVAGGLDDPIPGPKLWQ